MNSPEYVRLSLAAAMTLKFKGGMFYRNAKLGCINLLMQYEDGCKAKCKYCGQNSNIEDSADCRNLIRVEWPSYKVTEVADSISKQSEKNKTIERVCISSIVHGNIVDDFITILRQVRKKSDIPVSALISPTNFNPDAMKRLKAEGIDKIGIAVDCATPELFEDMRGSKVKGPHRWGRYLENIKAAVDIMGHRNAGVHLMIGLGETERESIKFMQEIYDMGGTIHLFSFYPEGGSELEDHPQADLEQYRANQIARYLLHEGLTNYGKMKFDEEDKVLDFGLDPNKLKEVLSDGKAFETSGCSGCNRPFSNETPDQAMNGEFRNYPFQPNHEDIEIVFSQLSRWHVS
jgi:biotin synthase